MAQKRLFADVADLDDNTEVADVQFGIKTLSPLKKSKKGTDYYNGDACDDTKSTYLKGQSSEVEIHVNPTTEVEQTSRKSDVKQQVIPESSISEIFDMDDCDSEFEAKQSYVS
uniref:Uncharacterized protein n=1 Tax=Amphimedon queenslandica TaxID=400682 RepID=A0A1X7VL29_AMPQE